MRPVFTVEEYETRVARVRSAMHERGMDALIVSDPANMNWLSGYDAWSFYSHQAVVVTHDREPMWWGRELDVEGARRTTHVADTSIVGFPEEHVQSEHHPHRDLARVLHDRGLGRSRIGVESDAPYFTAAAREALSESLPADALVDATGLVNRARAVKSPQEIELMRKAGAITTAMFDVVSEAIEPGLPRHELVADIQRAATRGVGGTAGDYPAIVPLLPGGADGAAPHMTWDERPFEQGETYFFEMSGCVRRYHAPMSRSFTLGRPERHLYEVEAACLAGLDAGIETARAGTTAASVAQAVLGAMAERGVDRAGRCGYPVGIGYPPDWGERTYSLRPGDETRLESGMTLHLMPVQWAARAAVGITETIVVTPEGPAESLVEYPRRLFASDPR